MLSNSRRSKFISLSLVAVAVLRKAGRTEYTYRHADLKVYTDEALVGLAIRLAATVHSLALEVEDVELAEEARALASKLRHYTSQ